MRYRIVVISLLTVNIVFLAIGVLYLFNEDLSISSSLNMELSSINKRIETLEKQENQNSENVDYSEDYSKKMELSNVRKLIRESYLSACILDDNLRYDENLVYNFYQVLISNNPYYLEDNNMNKIFMNEFYIDEYPVSLHEFCIIDINQDECPELILHIYPADLVLVIRSEGGKLLGSIYSNRQMGGITTKGLFLGSGSAFNIVICKLNIEEGKIVKEILGERYEVTNDDFSVDRTYKISDKEVTEENFNGLLDEFLNAQQPVWYEIPEMKYIKLFPGEYLND